MNLSGSKTSIGDQVLFGLGERLSISITSSFPLLLPPFIADVLNEDIYTHNYKIRENKCNKHKNITQT